MPSASVLVEEAIVSFLGRHEGVILFYKYIITSMRRAYRTSRRLYSALPILWPILWKATIMIARKLCPFHLASLSASDWNAAYEFLREHFPRQVSFEFIVKNRFDRSFICWVFSLAAYYCTASTLTYHTLSVAFLFEISNSKQFPCYR